LGLLAGIQDLPNDACGRRKEKRKVKEGRKEGERRKEGRKERKEGR
jgi:hypothetical protein